MNFVDNEKINHSEMLFYSYLFFMLTFLLLRNAMGINIPVVFLLLLTILPAFFGSASHIIATAVCCIPMATGFQYKYALFICIVALFIRNRGRIRISRVAYPVILMLIWELLHCFFSYFSFWEYLRDFAELIFLVIVLNLNFEKINHKLIFRALAITTICICFIMLYIQISQVDFNIDSVFGRGFRNYRFGQANTTAENYGINFNPNRLGNICNITIASLLILIQRKEHTSIDFVLLALVLIFGLMTLSRTFIVSLVFILFFYIFTKEGAISLKIINAIGSITFIFIVLFFVSKYIPDVLHNVILRFQEEELLGGRDKLFLFYHNHIFSSVIHFFFGIGLQGFQAKIQAIHNVDINVAHNGFQEIWVVWGIVGVLLFIWMLSSLIKEAKLYEPHPSITHFLTFGIWLLNSMSGQLIRSEIALLSLVIVFISLSLPNKNKGREHENWYCYSI